MKINLIELRRDTSELSAMDTVFAKASQELYDNGSVEFLKNTVIPRMSELMADKEDGQITIHLCDTYDHIGSMGVCGWSDEYNHLHIHINMGMVFEPVKLYDIVCHELIHAQDYLTGKLSTGWFGYSFDNVMYQPSAYRHLKHHQLPWEKVPNRVGKMLGKYWNKVFNGMDVKMTKAMEQPFVVSV